MPDQSDIGCQPPDATERALDRLMGADPDQQDSLRRAFAMKSIYAMVGMQHRGMAAFVSSMPAGETVRLVREPTNKYDPNAIQCWMRGKHVGFIKATAAPGLARIMDAGAAVEFVGRLVPREWPMVEVDEANQQEVKNVDVG